MFVYHVTTLDHHDAIQESGVTPAMTPGYGWPSEPEIRVVQGIAVWKSVELLGEEDALVTRLAVDRGQLTGDPGWVVERHPEFANATKRPFVHDFEGLHSLGECDVAACAPLGPESVMSCRHVSLDWHAFLCSAVGISKQEFLDRSGEDEVAQFYEHCLWMLFEGHFDDPAERVRRVWQARQHDVSHMPISYGTDEVYGPWDEECDDNWEDA